MTDIDLDIRMELFRIRPELMGSHADELISEISQSFRDVRQDCIAHCQSQWRDFFSFSLVDEVALAAIYRGSHLEIFAFAANETLVTKAERLAMVDVDEFLQMLHQDFRVPEIGLRFPMSQALPWLETVEGA
jgi:hypothetical protein